MFWTLPTEYMTGYAAAAGIGLINSLGALLFAITALFKKANEVEAGHLDEVDAHYVPHDVAEAVRGPHPSRRRAS